MRGRTEEEHGIEQRLDEILERLDALEGPSRG